jgi:hypothetical protein
MNETLPAYVILKSFRRPNAAGGGFFRSVSNTQLTDPIVADLECLKCGDRLGFGVPLAQPDGYDLPLIHLSCYISEECSECGITTVNFIEHASNGMYRCAEYFACERRKDQSKFAEAMERLRADSREIGQMMSAMAGKK